MSGNPRRGLTHLHRPTRDGRTTTANVKVTPGKRPTEEEQRSEILRRVNLERARLVALASQLRADGDRAGAKAAMNAAFGLDVIEEGEEPPPRLFTWRLRE